jgi:hypothetical protein
VPIKSKQNPRLLWMKEYIRQNRKKGEKGDKGDKGEHLHSSYSSYSSHSTPVALCWKPTRPRWLPHSSYSPHQGPRVPHHPITYSTCRRFNQKPANPSTTNPTVGVDGGVVSAFSKLPSSAAFTLNE